VAKGNHPDEAYDEERHAQSRQTTFPGPPGGRRGEHGRKSAPPGAPIAADWEKAFRTLLAKVPEVLAEKKSECLRIDALERQVERLRKLVGEVQHGDFIVVPVRTLGDEPVELTGEIPVLVQGEDDNFVATYFDAGVSMSGDTQQEAVDNLKAHIVDLFEFLEREEDKLGPWPRKQLATLRTVLRRVA
jgi:hypothetical protein